MAAGLVGAVLMLAGMGKIAGSAPPPGLPRWVGTTLPFVELVVGALVLAGVRPAGVAAALLLAAFTAWLVRQLARGDRRPCRCFGETSGRPVSGWTVGRNLVLLGAALIAAAGVDRPAGWPGRVLGAALGAALVLAESRIGVAG